MDWFIVPVNIKSRGPKIEAGLLVQAISAEVAETVVRALATDRDWEPAVGEIGPATKFDFELRKNE